MRNNVEVFTTRKDDTKSGEPHDSLAWRTIYVMPISSAAIRAEHTSLSSLPDRGVAHIRHCTKYRVN